ncbi:peroxiredoxin family protein [Kribbia dieselivorans]|uniref:peroxiredoxin family protein n=1 Tax=Kribbia dieselivorans TaxID=331526 RepID=UPI000838863A|nr:peroxiredoxin family protein [Kribbia dieselivorans]
MTSQQDSHRAAVLEEVRHDQQQAARRHALRTYLTVAAGLVVIALVTFGLVQARPTSTAAEGAGAAPAFTLPTTAGTKVSLADYRGTPVVLYFNEGAGCGSCTQQMAAIEQDPDFAKAGITVLPIVMNTAEQIAPDLRTFGVTTPYLLDDGTTSKAYGALGKGMHEGLPGHGFVLIDADGVQRWQGDYPSMWLDPQALLKQVRKYL